MDLLWGYVQGWTIKKPLLTKQLSGPGKLICPKNVMFCVGTYYLSKQLAASTMTGTTADFTSVGFPFLSIQISLPFPSIQISRGGVWQEADF